MKISIVIPVYNEADSLGACLEAISRQTEKPYEVIVVNNNSTDGTVKVAQSFDFVTLLNETRQGVVHARNRGFNAARGDIIARIDADSVLPVTWFEAVHNIFELSDIDAVSGAPHYYDFPLARLADAIDLPLRARLARKLGDTNFLWGANMALRRSAWLKVRRSLCQENGLHEDFDLAIHLQERGHQVSYDEKLLANVSSRRIDTSFAAYVRYTMVSPRTYAAHNLKSRRHMYSVLAVCWLLYLPARLIYRSYNPQTGSFSVSQLRAATASRIDPTTNII